LILHGIGTKKFVVTYDDYDNNNIIIIIIINGTGFFALVIWPKRKRVGQWYAAGGRSAFYSGRC
jgi:hypothetical protein